MMLRIEVALRRALGWVLTLLMWRPGRKRLAAQLTTARRVLLVRIDNRVGEALLTTPLVGALRDRFTVELLVHPKCVRVLEGLPGVAAIHPFERGWLRFGPFGGEVRRLRALARGAVVVNCASWNQHSGTAAIVSRLLAPSSCVVGPSVAPAAGLMDVTVEPLRDTQSEVLQRLHLLTPLLGKVPTAPLSFRPPRATEAVKLLASAIREPFVVVNPGGRLDERRVPAECFIALCRRALELGRTPLVTWGPGEEALASSIVAAAPGAVLAPATNLDELAFLMQRAQVVACNNTGPMHLAVAVGTPTLALFYKMPMERWGHPFAPHRMVDLTSCATADEMRRVVEEALTVMAPAASASAV